MKARTYPTHVVDAARAAQAWLARGAAIKVGDQHIGEVVDAGIQTILDTPELSEERAKVEVFIHVLNRERPEALRMYEAGWDGGREWQKVQASCETCRATPGRVKTLTSGWVRCPDCAPLVHMAEETDHVRCSIDSPERTTTEEGQVTCPDCLQEMLQPSDAEMRMARWVGRTIAYLRAEARRPQAKDDPQRDDLLADADAIWKKEDPDEWDRAVEHAAERARCFGCGREKDRLLVEGHAAGCAWLKGAKEEGDG